ncbi:porin family protein [Fluviicola sp.]|uniref:porin family protein n=1 Tax=Fluviicola sp. TaxID=1917219 RepID=UPI00261C2B9E|nr:porin family protein [Fluviicola sp.]
MIFILLLIPGLSVSQLSDTLYRRLSIGISYEANLSGRQLNYSLSNQWVADLRNENEMLKYGYTAGLVFRYRLHPKLNLETGLRFADRGYTSPKETLVWESPDPKFPSKVKTTVSMNYVEIPVRFNYKLKVGKLDIYAMGGLSLNFLTNKVTRFKMYYENVNKDINKDKTDYGFEERTYSFSLGIGINIPFAKRLLLNVEPVYSQNFTSIVADKNAREYLYSIGVNTKLFLRMKKKTKKA